MAQKHVETRISEYQSAFRSLKARLLHILTCSGSVYCYTSLMSIFHGCFDLIEPIWKFKLWIMQMCDVINKHCRSKARFFTVLRKR
jgi:hypothetical protein